MQHECLGEGGGCRVRIAERRTQHSRGRERRPRAARPAEPSAELLEVGDQALGLLAMAERDLGLDPIAVEAEEGRLEEPVARARSATPSSVLSAAAASASESSRKPRVASNSSSPTRAEAARQSGCPPRSSPGRIRRDRGAPRRCLHREREGRSPTCPLRTLASWHSCACSCAAPSPPPGIRSAQRKSMNGSDARLRDPALRDRTPNRSRADASATRPADEQAVDPIRTPSTCDQGGACSSDIARSIVAIATPSPPSVSRKATSASAPASTVGHPVARPVRARSGRTRGQGTPRFECRHQPRPSRISIRSRRSSAGSASAAKKMSAPALNPSSCAQTHPSRTSASARPSPCGDSSTTSVSRARAWPTSPASKCRSAASMPRRRRASPSPAGVSRRACSRSRRQRPARREPLRAGLPRPARMRRPRPAHRRPARDAGPAPRGRSSTAASPACRTRRSSGSSSW